MSAANRTEETNDANGERQQCALCHLPYAAMEWHPADDRNHCPRCQWKLPARQPDGGGRPKVVSMTRRGKQVGGDHYAHLKIHPAHYCEINGLTPMEFGVIKYVTRHRFKEGVMDIDKAIDCLKILRDHYYPEAAEPDTGTR